MSHHLMCNTCKQNFDGTLNSVLQQYSSSFIKFVPIFRTKQMLSLHFINFTVFGYSSVFPPRTIKNIHFSLYSTPKSSKKKKSPRKKLYKRHTNRSALNFYVNLDFSRLLCDYEENVKTWINGRWPNKKKSAFRIFRNKCSLSISYGQR